MKILVVAGEASADLHAAEILEKLGKEKPLELIGIGGDRLRRLGLNPVRDAREMGVVGLAEVIKRIPATLKLIGQLAALAAKEKPAFALLCDLPDFNLRLAPKLKAAGIPVVYYVSPQVWAWRSGRVHAMAECIDLLLSILPFERDWYAQHSPRGLRVDYVGHPSVTEIPALPYAPEQDLIALLPGSREGEIQSLLPDLLRAAVILKGRHSGLRFELPLAEPLRKSPLARTLLDPAGALGENLKTLGDSLRVVETPAHETLRRARFAFVASGTATLETGIVGAPMVVLYKVAALSAFIFRHLVRYRGPVAMVNLIHKGIGSEERVVTELLQEQVNPENLASEGEKLLNGPDWERQRAILAGTRALLSGAGEPVGNAVARIRAFLAEKGIA